VDVFPFGSVFLAPLSAAPIIIKRLFFYFLLSFPRPLEPVAATQIYLFFLFSFYLCVFFPLSLAANHFTSLHTLRRATSPVEPLSLMGYFWWLRVGFAAF